MRARASITIARPREQVEHFWHDPQYRPGYIQTLDAAVRLVDAPGDHGTEIRVEFERSGRGRALGEVIQKLRGTAPLAKVKDDLRRFKQRVETGEVARSDAVPEGERLERKFKQRPAQPLKQDELQKVGAR